MVRGPESEVFKIVNKESDRIAKELAREAARARKQELAQEKAREREEQRRAKVKVKYENKHKGKSIYNVVIIAQLEYKADEAPDEKKLAEDIGRTIKKWADQKRFYGIDPKEPVPELVSLDVDIQ